MCPDAMTDNDPYCWPASKVLRNRFSLRDAQQLTQAELAFTALRAATVELRPRIVGLPHLCALHRTLFQDVYDWAGQLRCVNIFTDDTPYCHFEYLEKQGNALMAQLEAENGLLHLAKADFVERLAYFYAEMNILHPFRHGNGRTQRLFFEQVALHAGYFLNWDQTQSELWMKANRESVTGQLQGLEAIFARVVSEVRSDG